METLLDATGNRFLLIDAWGGPRPLRPEQVARGLRATHPDLDGLLVLSSERGGRACRMELFNVDGSRASFCGNGLRCVAKVAVERGYLRGPTLDVFSASGEHRVEVVELAGRVTHARACIGRPRRLGRHELELSEARVSVELVDVGNLHAVCFWPEIAALELETWGPPIERHPLFSDRANVEFVSIDGPGAIRVRFWERGVGETGSCGSGAVAAAASLTDAGSTRLTVRTRGGELEVSVDPQGAFWLQGAVREMAQHEQPIEGRPWKFA